MFNQRKVAQMAAFLLRRRGCMNYLKLMKLLYLADRESMKRYHALLAISRIHS